MNEIVKDMVKKALYYGGYYSLYRVLHKPYQHRLLILMYHNIVEDVEQKSDWFLKDNPTRNHFERLLKIIKNKYRVISVEDAVSEIRSIGRLKEKSLAITIDDGYLSAYQIAFPLLKKYSMTATIYIPTDWINRKYTPWWMLLTGLIKYGNITPQTLAEVESVVEISTGVNFNKFESNARNRYMLLTKIEFALMRKEDNVRDKIINELGSILMGSGNMTLDLQEPINWNQIKEMSEYGIRFGAHTCSHPNLSYIDPQTAEHEIVGSKREIERRLGIDVSGFAYPYGYDMNTYVKFKTILQNHNFKYACVSMPGYVTPQSNLYLLNRISMPISISRAILARSLDLEYIDMK